MSLDSKYNKMNKFTNLLTKVKNLKPKKLETQLKKERIMKNVDKLYEKYYSAYKNYYDADELSEARQKKFDCKQFELFDKTDKKLTLHGETKKMKSQNWLNCQNGCALESFEGSNKTDWRYLGWYE